MRGGEKVARGLRGLEAAQKQPQFCSPPPLVSWHFPPKWGLFGKCSGGGGSSSSPSSQGLAFQLKLSQLTFSISSLHEGVKVIPIRPPPRMPLLVSIGVCMQSGSSSYEIGRALLQPPSSPTAAFMPPHYKTPNLPSSSLDAFRCP